ncbi:uncharacterized protein [Linepithema humile]|uniref:uncharacterized protein n=1 Tax=Linepithema humile TaxID=83485 RepID=UPI0006234CA1|nr:PREDICTED: uncharacterized protein LOC105677141 [Linepithema humile]
MKRGTKCVAQTINLSKPKTCVRPKIQKLVSADADSYFDSPSASSYCGPRPVTVKVCSREDMQRKCQPKLCDCPPKPSPRPLSSGEKLCRIVMFLLKGTVAGGLIYWTRSEGLWGDSTQTEDLYYRMISTIATDRQEDLPLEGIKYSIAETYNHMLLKGMNIIVSVPREMHRKLRDILFSCGTEETKAKSAKHYDRNLAEI